MKLFIVISILCLIAQAWCCNVLMFCIYVCVDMRWFGKAVPLIAMGKKTVKQPCHVSTLHPLLTQMFQSTFLFFPGGTSGLWYIFSHKLSVLSVGGGRGQGHC